MAGAHTPRSLAPRWLFLDLNSYFASVEQQSEPALRGRPVGVVPLMTRSTCVIAASYEAKAHGVKTGTHVREARALCPGMVFVPARHNLYVDYHHRVVDEVERHMHVDEVCSIDEVACRLMGRECVPEAAVALARRIKQGILDNVGACLRTSVGIAPNRFLAKVASDMEKPDGLTLLAGDVLPQRLFDLDIEDLPGIGRAMERRLRAAGVSTVRALWELEPKHARKIWGGVQGERFWYMLHGHDIPPVDTDRRSVGHSHVLPPDWRRPDRARWVARRLVVKAASRLRRMGYYTSRLGLTVRFVRRDRWADEHKVTCTQDTFTLLEALNILWVRMEATTAPGNILKVGVYLTALVTAEDRQRDFFLDRMGERKLRLRHHLSRAMDTINTRFGRDALMVGAPPLPRNADQDFMGVKIAFTRIPDRAEFKE